MREDGGEERGKGDGRTFFCSVVYVNLRTRATPARTRSTSAGGVARSGGISLPTRTPPPISTIDHRIRRDGNTERRQDEWAAQEDNGKTPLNNIIHTIPVLHASVASEFGEDGVEGFECF